MADREEGRGSHPWFADNSLRILSRGQCSRCRIQCWAESYPCRRSSSSRLFESSPGNLAKLFRVYRTDVFCASFLARLEKPTRLGKSSAKRKAVDTDNFQRRGSAILFVPMDGDASGDASAGFWPP